MSTIKSTVQIDTSYVVTVNIRYHGPTNASPSRLTAWRSDMKYRDDPNKVRVSYDHSLDAKGNAEAVLRQYLANRTQGWEGRWVLGSHGPDNWVAVQLPPTTTNAIVREFCDANIGKTIT